MKRKAKDTLTAIEMNKGEVEEFELRSGETILLDPWILFRQMYEDGRVGGR